MYSFIVCNPVTDNMCRAKGRTGAGADVVFAVNDAAVDEIGRSEAREQDVETSTSTSTSNVSDLCDLIIYPR
ncbi:MAG: hypothetical protein H0U23_07935 [Blastocatellia bacterium]|nr:hypothetical protein [Blastocatellia bacterium]